MEVCGRVRFPEPQTALFTPPQSTVLKDMSQMRHISPVSDLQILDEGRFGGSNEWGLVYRRAAVPLREIRRGFRGALGRRPLASVEVWSRIRETAVDVLREVGVLGLRKSVLGMQRDRVVDVIQ